MSDNTSQPSQDWVEHAYPLQQVTIHLQGTRHSLPEHVISQLETVLNRLRNGDTFGEDHDDDFGYRFMMEPVSNGPSFFEGPCGLN